MGALMCTEISLAKILRMYVPGRRKVDGVYQRSTEGVTHKSRATAI